MRGNVMKITIPFFDIMCSFVWGFACVLIYSSGLDLFSKIGWLVLVTIFYLVIMRYDVRISVELNRKKEGDNNEHD